MKKSNIKLKTTKKPDNGSLIHFDWPDVELLPAAEAARKKALKIAKVITKVESPEENQKAVEAQTELLGLTRSVEKVRKEIKAPLLDMSKRIDTLAKDYVEPLQAENQRISGMIGDYQILLQHKRNAEEQALREELAQREREREEEIANAKNLDEVTEIRERYSLEAQAIEAPPPPPTVEKQILRSDWKIEVTDIWTLARLHPTCVKIEPRLIQIKELLDAGHQVAGIRAERVINASVRS